MDFPYVWVENDWIIIFEWTYPLKGSALSGGERLVIHYTNSTKQVCFTNSYQLDCVLTPKLCWLFCLTFTQHLSDENVSTYKSVTFCLHTSVEVSFTHLGGGNKVWHWPLVLILKHCNLSVRLKRLWSNLQVLSCFHRLHAPLSVRETEWQIQPKSLSSLFVLSPAIPIHTHMHLRSCAECELWPLFRCLLLIELICVFVLFFLLVCLSCCLLITYLAFD